jgi:uncharacterized protein
MSGLDPEQQVRLPVLRSQWLTSTFVHWRYDPGVVAPLVPDGLTVQTFDGSAWVGLVPFLMADLRPPGLTFGPLGTFAGANLRTYVAGPGGRDGLWFFTMEAASPLMVAGTRLAAGAPYHLGKHAIDARPRRVAYTGARHGGGPAYRVVVRPGARSEPDDLAVWLTGRWRAYTAHLGRLLETPVSHEPWPLRRATLDDLDQSLTEAVGLPAPEGEPTVHYSDGVRRCRIGVTRPVG